ncbi:hypothetical protein D9758_014333 [Tetrapyrgos nigripes]|uniref:BTB domain-containing protein n=1 Tax=Tetrapyrgos nigripes TaxID=182062 RepID=A0A8H5FIU3_9AGAR|nr:hypothetical protein D9758_014333 [Tetrapyrgos nigripes]
MDSPVLFEVQTVHSEASAPPTGTHRGHLRQSVLGSWPLPSIMENAHTGHPTASGFLLEDWIDTTTTGMANDASASSASYSQAGQASWGFHLPQNPKSGANGYSLKAAIPQMPDGNANQGVLQSDSFYLDGQKTNENAAQPQAVLTWDEQTAKSLTLSTAFQEVPTSPNLPRPDIILVSSDRVVFYVDQQILLKHSNNCFGGLLPLTAKGKAERVRQLADVSSSDLNIILHLLYNLDPTQYQTPLTSIISAIDHLPKYGYIPKSLLTSRSFLYKVLLFYTPLYPLRLYLLCGKHDLYELAVAVSSNTLSTDLSSLTDDDAERMGSVYLGRLFRLHRSRIATLKASLMPPPALHNPTKECGFENQRVLSSAWMMATAYLLWSAKPDTSTSAIRGVFNSMTKHITCRDCCKGRDDRINKIVINWSLSKCTI